MCAVAYAMLLEELRRRVDVERQAAMFARALGSEVEVPDEDEIRRRFDAMLCESAVDEAALPTDRTSLLLEAFGAGRR